MDWWPVSSQSLMKRSIDLDGRIHKRAAILPFFNSEGSVSRCMIVLPEQSRLYFFVPSKTKPKVPLFGTIRFRHHQLSWCDGSDGPNLAELWHYDDAWLLKDQRFLDKEIVPAMCRTNCCGQLTKKVSRFYFRRDLSRVACVGHSAGENFRLVPLKSVLSAPAPRTDTPEVGSRRLGGQRLGGQRLGGQRVGWRLDPTWMK